MMEPAAVLLFSFSGDAPFDNIFSIKHTHIK